MAEAISHRGPDGKGLERSKCKHTVFSHRMLSIVDVGNYVQPFVYKEQGIELLLTFNGEIYNYLELRESLATCGHIFRTKSDTEVLLHAYLEWGEGCVEYFDGDFAFAIYDGRNRCLTLARDRLGVKPLFYYFDKEKFYFGSEPKAFFPVLGKDRKPDLITIADFFLEKDILVDACARPDRSFYENVRCLEPGSILQVRVGNPKITILKYWEPSFHRNKDKDIGRFSTEIRNELIQAVVERVPGEVDYGALLSGGVDSSIISSILLEQSKKPTIATINFTRGYNPDIDYAELFAERFSIELDAYAWSPASLLEELDALVYAMDEPHDTSRQLGLLLAYKRLSDRNCKVAIVGEGSDEFNFGYYYSYPGFGVDAQLISSKSEFLKKCILRSDFANQWLTADFRAMHPASELLEFSYSRYFDCDSSESYLDAIQRYYINRFLKYRLDVNDRCAMYYGIESRVPYCDHKLVEFFLEVPPQLNCEAHTEKRILRNAFQGRLPDVLLFRKKHPLPENNTVSMHNLIIQQIERRMPRLNSGIWDIVDRNRVLLELNKYMNLIHSFDYGGFDSGTLRELSQPTLLTATPKFRAKHFFLLLSLFTWYNTNFGD